MAFVQIILGLTQNLFLGPAGRYFGKSRFSERFKAQYGQQLTQAEALSRSYKHILG